MQFFISRFLLGGAPHKVPNGAAAPGKLYLLSLTTVLNDKTQRVLPFKVAFLMK